MGGFLSTWSEQGLLFIVVHSFLIEVDCLVEQGSRHTGLLAVAHGLSCSEACGIFQDQGSSQRPLYWQADSFPLYHQGGPPLAS